MKLLATSSRFFFFIIVFLIFPTCVWAATGQVQFSVSPAYQFGTAGSYLSDGNTISKVFDGDLTSWWDAPSANGGYAGVDLTVPAQVTDMLIAPRPSYTSRVFGTLVQGATVSSSTGPWTTLYTVPSYPPFYPQLQYSDIPINTNGQYYRYYRIVPPNGDYGSIAELRFLGVASSTTPYIPMKPIISPNSGGKYALPVQVSITSSTTDAAIYYTTDGTIPTFSSGSPQGTTLLYTSPFLATSTATTTVQAIAVSANTYVSDVSAPAYFNITPSFFPANNWYDTSSNLIEGHDGSVSYLNGKYYWYGENFNNSGSETELLGIQAYSSADLLNWKNEGLVFYTANSYKLRRPHVIYNATSSLYVMWARNATAGRIFMATSTTPTGPFNMATTSYNTPSGYGNNDISLFQDNDGTAYVIFVSNDETKTLIYKLASDYMSVTGSYVNITNDANRDAPIMFRRGSIYFLVSSGQNSWTATNVKYATSTSPMGTFSTLSNPFQPATQDYTTGYNTIDSDIFNIRGRTDGYVYEGERYDSSAPTTGSLYNSRFIWQPITFPNSGTMSIAWQSPWSLDGAFTSSALPAAATGINVQTNISTQATVTWTNNETTGYTLYLDRATDAGFTQNVISTFLPAGTVSTIDTSVSKGNVYYYRIRTVNGAGTSVSTTGIGNYSLASDVTPPTINLLAPAANAQIIGNNVLLSASSTDNVGVNSVGFYIDNSFVADALSTTTPSNFYWNSNSVADGIHSLVAVATDYSGNAATTTSININVANHVPMLFTSTSTVFQTSTTTISLTGNATTWTAGTPGTPAFTVSGGSGASIVSQSVASSTSATILLAAGKSVGNLQLTDPLSGATTSITVLADNIAPVVNLTSPTNGAFIVGTSTLTASSTDNVGIASVRFKLDGNTNIGSVGTTSPYSIQWNSTATSNGSHTVSVVVSDFVGNQSTSTLATVTVDNAYVPTVTTNSPASVSNFSATFNGNITNDGGASSTVRGFYYGLTSAYGTSTIQNGTFGIGAFSAAVSGLSCAATYHYQAYAVNLTGTSTGADQVFSTPTCPVANAAGEIQFSVSPAYQFGLTPSYLNLGHIPANVFDDDTSTWWDTQSANGAYVGLDLTVPAQVTRMRIAPRQGYTSLVYGAILQASNVSSSTGPWTNIYTIPSFPPYYAQRQLDEIPVSTGGATYRYYRLLMPNGSNGNLAEFRLIGLPGTTTPYIPMQPTISPNGGRFDLPTKVRITSITSDAALYYTTDGSIPTFSGGAPQGTTQLYTGAFLVSSSATTTVQAIAVSQGTFVSEVSIPAQFHINTDMLPGQDWLDTTGHLIESHGGGIDYFNGKYYWYGQIYNANDPENEEVGISCYSSPDLINWKDEGPIIYLGRSADVERPHVIYNSTTGQYVMWAHNIITYPNSRAYIAYSSTPYGPFTVATTTLNPDGMGINDMTLFEDTDGTGYVIYSNGTNTHFVVSKLSSDYLSTSGNYEIVAPLVNHEAPAMFKRNGVYYLLMSGVTGWAPNQNVYSTSTSPLGTWSTPISPFQPSAFQPVSTTYNSQTTAVFQVAGRTDSYVFMGDRFDDSNYLGGSLYNSRHLLLPMSFDSSGNLSISWFTNWNLNTAFATNTLPLPATGLNLSSTNSEVDLSWTNNASPDYSLFVDRATDNAFTQNVVSDSIASSTTSYVDTYNYNPSTVYYYRIRTLTGAGPSYSSIVSTSVISTPSLLTQAATGVSTSTATLNASIIATGGVNAIQSGFAYSTDSTLTASVSTSTLGSQTGTASFSQSISNLSPNTTYYFRAYATNSGSTGYGSVVALNTSDISPPVVSITVPANGSNVSGNSVSLSANATDDVGVVGVQFKLDGNTNIGPEIRTPSLPNIYTTTWDSTSVSVGIHTLSAVARDAAGNYSTSTNSVNLISLNVPTINSPFSTNISTSSAVLNAAIIDDGNSSSTIRGFSFGTTSSYGLIASSTGTYGVGSYSQTVSSLLCGTTYHFQAFSVNSSGKGISTDSTFLTNPCSNYSKVITSAQGGMLQYASTTDPTRNITLTIPSSSVPNDTEFALTEEDPSTVVSQYSMPSVSLLPAATEAYLLSATQVASSSVISSFSNPITITMGYTPADIIGINEASLVIYRLDGSTWYGLSNCSVDTTVHTVTCSTSNFSTFMIFGSPVSSPGVIVTPAVPAIVAGNGPVYAQYGQVNVQPGSASLSKNTIVNITTPTTITSKNVANTSVSVATSTSTQSKAFQFTKDLRYGMTSSNVKKLQQFLNSHGFVVSKKGIGSFGKETNYFGLATQLALMKFQNFYKKDILVPQGLKKPNGIMGHATRKVINSMIQ